MSQQWLHIHLLQAHARNDDLGISKLQQIVNKEYVWPGEALDELKLLRRIQINGHICARYRTRKLELVQAEITGLLL